MRHGGGEEEAGLMVVMRTPAAEVDVCHEGGRRARKGKAGQKKQPQRGLGVAQLEKLRMQEHNKQQHEAAAAALFHTSSSPYAKQAVDDDVFRTLVSLASSGRKDVDTQRFLVNEAAARRASSYALASPPVKSPFFSSALVDAESEVVAKVAPIFAFTNLQCFKSSLGPVSRPKELSSFQSFLSNQPWSTTPQKSCGWKRPWHDTGKLMHSDSLDLNAAALAGGVAHDHHVADGAHDFQSNVRCASEDGLKTRMCGMWDENQGPECKRQDRCSSDFPPSSLTLNRRRCLSSPETPQKSGDFLTLGLSTFPVVTEVDDREEERCNKEAHDILQLPQQMRSHCSEGPAAHVRPLSFRFFPLPSGRTGTKEDFLDLRLKLAL